MTPTLTLMLIFTGLISIGFSSESRILTAEYRFDNDFPKILSRTRRQQTEGGCIIPRSAPNGTYTLRGSSMLKEGELAPYNSILQLKCPPGYVISSSGAIFCDDVNNNWFEELPTCLKMCKPLKSSTVEFTCTIPSKNGQAIRGSCDSFLPPGTTAAPKCRSGHHSITSNKQIVCIDGRWAYSMPSCITECGQVTPHGTPNVINGTNAERGKFPWHVAIYSTYTTPDSPSIWCGGSIISRSLVISAAHCFYNPLSKTSLEADLFSIAVGKLFSDFNHPEETMDPFIQKSGVKRIEIPEDYQGEASSYSHDMALLILQTPLTFSDLIMPVCLNLVDKDFDEEQISPGLNATIAGFGLVDVNGPASDVLKTAVLPLVSKSKCKSDSPVEFSKYIVWDKICAGYLTGIGVCKGDSGGGLVVSSIERNRPTWYLRGIVSTSPKSENNDACATNTYSTFTRPFLHKEFIEDVIYKQGCTMPDNPPNGKFMLVGVKNSDPGQGVGHKLQLALRCDDGYAPSERENNVCDEFIDDWIKDFATCELIPAVAAAPSGVMEGCVIPNHPQNGKFVILVGPKDKDPGDIVPQFSVMTLKCEYGTTTTSEINVCGTDGNWASKLGTCELTCKTLVSLNVRYNCSIPVDGKPNLILNCDDPLPSGSIATPHCEEGHSSSERLQTLVCKHGFWDRSIPTCTATCGKSTVDALDPLEQESREYALKGEFPWNAVIHFTKMNYFQLVCIGTILSRLHVITSANCIGGGRNIFQHVVSVGKIHNHFNHTEGIQDKYIQTRSIKNVELPVTYEKERKFSFDIGIIVLNDPIIFSSYVMPICYNLENVILNNYQLRNGTVARVAGFGQKAEERSTPSELKALTMPIYDLPTCEALLKPEFHELLGEDKVCAGVINGTNLYRADSGTALAVSGEDESGETSWYIRGIASYVPETYEEYDIQSPIIFTKLFEHKYFIETIFNGTL